MKSFIDRVWDSTLQVTWKTTTYRQKCSKTGLFSPHCWAQNPGILHARKEVCNWTSPQLINLIMTMVVHLNNFTQKILNCTMSFMVHKLYLKKTVFLKEKTTASWNLVWFWKTSTLMWKHSCLFQVYIVWILIFLMYFN